MSRFVATFGISIAFIFLAVGSLNASNPLLMPSEAPYKVPRFDRIHAADILPAIEEGIREYTANIERIEAVKLEEATFENIIGALSLAGRRLQIPQGVLNYMEGNFKSDSIAQIALKAAPLLANYDGRIAGDLIFERVKTLYDKRTELGLDSLQQRMLAIYYRRCVRGGALCTPKQRERLREINAEISRKSRLYEQNAAKARNNFVIYTKDTNMLAGLSRTVRARFAYNAQRRGHPGMWAIGITNDDYQVVLSTSKVRNLCETLYKGYDQRGMAGQYDNRSLSADLINLRLEKARLLGYDTYADYALQSNMACDSAGVYGLLLPLVQAAIAKARREQAELEAYAVKYEGDTTFRMMPWDMSYYSGKLYRERFGSGAVSRYLLFDNVLQKGVFYVAERLYGITFTQRTDIPVYHKDVLTFEAKDADGVPLGLVYVDCFVRRGKRTGAWTSLIRPYSCVEGQETLPLVAVSCNFRRAAAGKPQLMSMSEVRALFHEFGHAFVRLLARGPYPEIVGRMPRDLVELPSQLNEHWAREPEVMKHYALDFETGRPIPYQTIDRLEASENYMKGSSLARMYASMLIDLEWHLVRGPIEGGDVERFEKELLARYGFPEYITPAYRTTYFNHIFSGPYSSQFYAYAWSAVLDTDAFAAFIESGDIFNPEVARRFRRYMMTEIGYNDPMTQYVRFRGAMPDPGILMRRYGFVE